MEGVYCNPSAIPPGDNPPSLSDTATSLEETTFHKRKLEGASEELLFPCKKVAVAMPLKTNNVSVPCATAPKLTKAERDTIKLEKAKERELERQKRDEAKLKREEERVKKVQIPQD